jgi:hypothetical protein
MDDEITQLRTVEEIEASLQELRRMGRPARHVKAFGPLVGQEVSGAIPANPHEHLIGAPGFEPGTSSPPDWHANQAAPRPVTRPS